MLNVHMGEVLSIGQKNKILTFSDYQKRGKTTQNRWTPELFRVSGFCRTQGYAHILGLIADSAKRNRTTSIFFVHRGLLPLSRCLTLDRCPVGH